MRKEKLGRSDGRIRKFAWTRIVGIIVKVECGCDGGVTVVEAIGGCGWLRQSRWQRCECCCSRWCQWLLSSSGDGGGDRCCSSSTLLPWFQCPSWLWCSSCACKRSSYRLLAIARRRSTCTGTPLIPCKCSSKSILLPSAYLPAPLHCHSFSILSISHFEIHQFCAVSQSSGQSCNYFLDLCGKRRRKETKIEKSFYANVKWNYDCIRWIRSVRNIMEFCWMKSEILKSDYKWIEFSEKYVNDSLSWEIWKE